MFENSSVELEYVGCRYARVIAKINTCLFYNFVTSISYFNLSCPDE